MIEYDYDTHEITLSPADFVRLYAVPEKEQPKRPERLTRALMRCHLAALAYAQEDDGGTCNFDAPMLDYRASGIPLREAKQAIADAGLSCYEYRMYGEKALVICGCQHGQGNRRTVMAEAFSRALKAQGYVCGMYYQMD